MTTNYEKDVQKQLDKLDIPEELFLLHEDCNICHGRAYIEAFRGNPPILEVWICPITSFSEKK